MIECSNFFLKSIWELLTCFLDGFKDSYVLLNAISVLISLVFCLGIIVKASDSLFSYRPRENHGTFYFPNFSPMFSATFTNATLEREAKEICGEDNFCLFDIAATGRVEIGAATMEAVKMIETIDEMTKPSMSLVIILSITKMCRISHLLHYRKLTGGNYSFYFIGTIFLISGLRGSFQACSDIAGD